MIVPYSVCAWKYLKHVHSHFDNGCLYMCSLSWTLYMCM